MAAPTSKDITHLAGTWNLNRQISDDTDEIFELQGIPWLVRVALRFGTITYHITQELYSGDDVEDVSNGSERSSSGSSHFTRIHLKQTISPTGFDSEKTYDLNGKESVQNFPIFGDVAVSMKFTKVEDIEDEVLRGCLAEESPSAMVVEENSSPCDATMNWKSRVFWGFETVHGERHLTRNSVVEKDGRVLKAKMVYDFQA